MIEEVEVKKISNGYLVEYDVMSESGMKEELYRYFSEKESVIAFLSELLA